LHIEWFPAEDGLTIQVDVHDAADCDFDDDDDDCEIADCDCDCDPAVLADDDDQN
jgi:hypothetical protein